MKKIILAFLALSPFIQLFAQNDDYVKAPTIGVHFFYNDFKTASEIQSSDLTDVLKSNDWRKTTRMSPGLAVSYIQGLSNHLDFAATLSGSFLDYPIPGHDSSGTNDLLLELAATANLKLTPDKYFVSPFLTLGAGASKYKGYYGAFVPVGVGLQVNLWDETFLLANAQYRIKITDNVNYHVYYSFGVAGNLSPKVKKKAPKPLPVPVVEVPKDTDGDGVIDANDKCPDVAGLASLQGCPDKDGDGIADANDKCPAVAGLAKYQGCPIPDTDGDGMNDEVDKCPTVAGVARYEGCPIPDTDGDGVNDEEDKCPTKAGTAANFGCPEIAKTVVDKINIAAGNIFFAPGSAKLLPKSFKSLNDVVKILVADSSLKMDIEGHTDNTGKPEKNQALSDQRSAAVKAYLKSKGVNEARLSSKGYGQDKPIADNKTAAGKAKNRRVELKARNY